MFFGGQGDGPYFIPVQRIGFQCIFLHREFDPGLVQFITQIHFFRGCICRFLLHQSGQLLDIPIAQFLFLQQLSDFLLFLGGFRLHILCFLRFLLYGIHAGKIGFRKIGIQGDLLILQRGYISGLCFDPDDVQIHLHLVTHRQPGIHDHIGIELLQIDGPGKGVDRKI